jgi:hypothetical protein
MPPQASPQPQRPPAYGGRKSTSVQPSSAVLIIPLPGIRLLVSASRHAAEWFHISTEKLCYQSQFLIGLAELSILNASFHRQLLAGEIAVFLHHFVGRNNCFDGFFLTVAIGM